MKRELITYYGNVQIPSGNVLRPDVGGVSHYQINTRYINNTRRAIRVKTRTGIEMVFPGLDHSSPRVNDARILIQHELVVAPRCVDDMRNYFMNISADETASLKLFAGIYKQVYEKVYSITNNKDMRCIVEFYINEADIVKAGGMLYHDELDTLFKLGAEPFSCHHPHSPMARIADAEHEASSIQDKLGFVFWVELVDNVGQYGERYISICNEVYKLVPRMDKNRLDGLYIVSSKSVNGKIQQDGVNTRFYALDTIEKELGIYKTYEMALSHGDIAGLRKKELADLEHAMTLDRQQFQRDKLRYETELEDRNRKVKDLEYERGIIQRQMDELKARTEHLIEMEKLRTKDRYERQSHDRKDASEFIRFLPTVLAAIGTALMAWRTFKSGS